MPAGPYHAASSSGSVQARNTCSMGASNTWVIATCWSQWRCGCPSSSPLSRRCRSSLSVRCSHSCLRDSIQSIASLRGSDRRRLGRHCASRPRTMRPAFSSTFRCRETAGMLIGRGAANSVTAASPSERRSTICRRVGSARAAKVRLNRSAFISRSGYLRLRLNNMREPEMQGRGARMIRAPASISARREKAFRRYAQPRALDAARTELVPAGCPSGF